METRALSCFAVRRSCVNRFASARANPFSWPPESRRRLSLRAPTSHGLVAHSTGARILEVGFIVATLGMAFMLAAQFDLGGSWRIGIDEFASPGLVTGGLYRFCHNPIYVGLIAGLVGIAIVLPTFSTLGLLVGVAWCVRSQTIDEEAYLERKYGDVFRRYATCGWAGFSRIGIAHRKRGRNGA